MTEMRTAGRYELQEELGRGAMGIVFKAFDPRIGRAVAVKTMRLTEAGTGMSHDELVNRFDIETKAAGRLTHPNIVVVYDAGEESGLFYITMELIQGRSLQAMIDQKQLFPLPRVIRIMEQAGSALDFAHQNSVVHRDIKPANLLMTGDDTVKVSDFGTAKILQKGATQTGAVLGTPSYMSPEQVKGKPVDGRSDIFSLGVILYELVTGEKPFPGQNVTTVIYKIVNEEPIPPREIDNSVHPGLSYVIMRALSKDSDDRYQNCKDLVDDLKNYKNLGGGTDSATVVMPGRSRPKEVEEAIARTRATASPASTRMTPAIDAQVAAAPPAPQRAPSPRPVTLPPLTGMLQAPAEEPRSHTGLWVTITLLVFGAIGGAGYYKWPDIQKVLNPGVPEAAQQSPPAATPSDTQPTAQPPEAPAKATAEASKAPAETKTAKDAAPPPSKAESAGAANAREIQNRLAGHGFGDRVRAEVSGRNVTLSGTVTAVEARRLRAAFQRLPGRMRLVDRLQIVRALPTPSATPVEAAGPAEKPKTAPGLGEVEIFTDQTGATVQLRGPNGEAHPTRQTPTRYEDLPPGRYTMEISKDGYRAIRRIVNIRAGNIAEESHKLQPLGGSLMVTSVPPQAEVLINGQARGVTPVTIPLSPGQYSVTLRKAGYSDRTETVRVEADQLGNLNVPLVRGQGSQAAAPAPVSVQQGAEKGFVEVRTIPPGADILINNSAIGRKTPSRIELAPGTYTLSLFVRGYQAVHRQIQVEPSKTLTLNEALPRQ